MSLSPQTVVSQPVAGTTIGIANSRTCDRRVDGPFGPGAVVPVAKRLNSTCEWNREHSLTEPVNGPSIRILRIDYGRAISELSARVRRPDHNDDATRRVAREQVRDPKSWNESSRRAYRRLSASAGDAFASTPQVVGEERGFPAAARDEPRKRRGIAPTRSKMALIIRACYRISPVDGNPLYC